MDKPEFTPAFFEGVQLSAHEQAKVDAFKAAWDRDPYRAIDDLLATEPGLVLKAMDHAIGPDAVRRLLQDEMDKAGTTVADLRAQLQHALKRRH